MSKPKHTPRPWTIRYEDHARYMIIRPYSDETEEEIEANVQLIAAAPEMLEALELVLKKVIYDLDMGDHSDVYDTVTKAIAKAKGK